MGEAFLHLKHKLEELGYHHTLAIEAVPLVECITSDLLQTTRSLQQYMKLSKEALEQRDSLLLEAEPYKNDNTRLIQENNKLHKELIILKEDNLRLIKENKRKIKSLSDELAKKESTVIKLQHDLRDLSLRSLCAETQSTRNKSRRKDCGDDNAKTCFCVEQKSVDKELIEMRNNLQSLEEKNSHYYDEIVLLKSQVDHRDNEIVRLNILLEGGRPLKQDGPISNDSKIQGLMKQIFELETANECLTKEIESSLEKQHEAMIRAMSLADKNKLLDVELKKTDALALKVEEDCNKKLSDLMSEVTYLHSQVDSLTKRNLTLEKEAAQNRIAETTNSQKIQESLCSTVREKETLQNEIKDLVELNKSLQEKIISLSQANQEYFKNTQELKQSSKYPTKDEIQSLLKSERTAYEKHIFSLQEKLSDTMNIFNNHMSKCKNTGKCSYASYDSKFSKDLHVKLCESEQKILMLKKENDELKSQVLSQDFNSKQNWKDVVSQLNAENSDLSKENICLSQQLNQFRNLDMNRATDRNEILKRNNEKLKEELEKLKADAELLRKDKLEYKLRHSDALTLIDKLRSDLAQKQSEIEQMHEENCSYKMTQRTGKASADRLREECNYLREQIKKMQSDVIKEKTMATQIKNIQIETERSSNELQSELLYLQKKISLSNDTIESLEKKCKDLQSEIISLKADKSSLVDNIKKIDTERDKLVIELDNKTETICALEHKVKTQTLDIRKLEDDVTDLKRKLNMNKVSEHKIVDSESQIKYLNGEIVRLTQQYENAVMENKHLQNNLADVNGNLTITRIDYAKSRKEVEELRQQLQHYVAEIRRIEEMLSQKEAERSDMLEHFASLSVEANILENTNHSLESESASKSMQLQNYVIKIQDMEAKLLDKETLIDKQSSRIAEMTCKINSLENEVKFLTEEKDILEQNNARLKQMCSDLQSVKKDVCEADSELKLYENKIKTLSHTKAKVEEEKSNLKDNLATTERLLSNARKEIVELKLALQDATLETKSLQDKISRLSRIESEVHERTLTKETLPPLVLEEIHEVSHEEDEDSERYHEMRRRYSSYRHGSTL